jgi:hypothetical protein
MENPEITLESDLDGYFRTIVKDVVKARRAAPDPVLEEYVLGLLTDSALGDVPIHNAGDVPLAIQLAEAMHAAAAVRFERLRQLGDSVLLLGGLYQPHLEHVGLDDRYVAHIGKTAYGAASSLLIRPTSTWIPEKDAATGPDIMRALASSFQALMHLLRDVADSLLIVAARTSGNLCTLVERWLRTRSTHLGHLLRSQGVVIGGLA